MSTSLLTIEDKLTFSSEKENDVSKEKEKTKEIQLMKDKINYVDEDEKKLKTLEEKIHPIEEKDKTKEEIKPKQENKPTIKKEEFNFTTDFEPISFLSSIVSPSKIGSHILSNALSTAPINTHLIPFFFISSSTPSFFIALYIQPFPSAANLILKFSSTKSIPSSLKSGKFP